MFRRLAIGAIMMHLIQLLRYLIKQGYSVSELTETFTVYFPAQDYTIDDILDYFDVEIDTSQLQYIERALPNIKSALILIEGL